MRVVRGPGVLNRSIEAEILRQDDLVALTVHAENVALDPSNSLLSVDDADRPAWIAFSFPAQHIQERAYNEAIIASSPPGKKFQAHLAGPSRVVVRLPPERSVQWTIPGLLQALSELDLVLPATARGAPISMPTHSEAPQEGLAELERTGPARVLAATVRAQAAEVRAAARDLLAGTDLRLFDRGVLERQVGPAAKIRRVSEAVRVEVRDRVEDLRHPREPFRARVPEVVPVPREPEEPLAGETAIELPYRLLIAPTSPGGHGFVHRSSAPERAGGARVELWHSRLGVRVNGEIDDRPGGDDPKIRAIWSRDASFVPRWKEYLKVVDATNSAGGKTLEKDLGETEALWSLTASDRADLVHQTSNQMLRSARPVDVRRLMLSSLGGWLDVQGLFPASTSPTSHDATGLLGWRHIATMGRDQYVRTAYDGCFYPTGHRATLVRITERKLRGPDPGTAWLYQRAFLIPQERIRHPFFDRQIPFQAIEIGLAPTPNLMSYATKEPFVPYCAVRADAGEADGDSFEPYRFPFSAADHDGTIVRFDMPLVWIPLPLAEHAVDAARTLWYKTLSEEKRKVNLRGQHVAFTPPSRATGQADAREARHEVDALWLCAAAAPVGATSLPFEPVLEHASIVMESLRALTASAEPIDVEFSKVYRDHDFDAVKNPGEVYLAVRPPKPGEVAPEASFSKATDRVGGFISPDFRLVGLSRVLGPVGGSGAGPNDGSAEDPTCAAAGGTFSPADFFGALADKAKLFGVLKLTEIIPTGALENMPRFVTAVLDQVQTLVSTATRLKKLAEDVSSRNGTNLASLTQDALSGIANTALTYGVNPLLAAGLAPADALQAAYALVRTLPDLLSAAIDSPGQDRINAVTNNLSALAALLGVLDKPGVLGSLLAKVAEATAAFQRQVEGQIAAANAYFQNLTADGAKVITAALTAKASAEEMARNQIVRVEWSTKLQNWCLPGASAPLFEPRGLLSIQGEVRGKDVGGKPAGLDLVATISDFTLNLIAPVCFFKITFQHIQFLIRAGKKPEIDVVLAKGGLEFAGPLSFVNGLKDIIPLDGFSDPPALAVSASGIDATFSMALPDIAVGMFSLQNLSLSAGFSIPFLGEALTVRFGFCSRQSPFMLTVCMLGGGGFFGLELAANKMKKLEAALEFGAAIGLDVGVASGSVSVVAGIYFKLEQADQSENMVATLTGYLRIRGEVDVLGLITASLELYMSLTYEAGKVTGTATLEIEVEIVCFSVTARASVTRRFAGGNDDPTFLELMTSDPYEHWAPWWNAFDAAA